MNKNTSVMAATIAVAGILTLAVHAHQAFAGNFWSDDEPGTILFFNEIRQIL